MAVTNKTEKSSSPGLTDAERGAAQKTIDFENRQRGELAAQEAKKRTAPSDAS